MTKFYTLKETCKILRCSERWLRYKKHEIGYVRFGKKILFPEAKLKEFIANHFYQSQSYKRENKWAI